MGHEGPHVVVRRVEDDFFRLAVLDDPAVFHDRDTAAQFQGFIEVVAYEYDGLAQLALQFQQLVLQTLADQWVERRERFVHQQDVGVHRQGTGQAHALLHTTGQLVGFLVAPLGQAHQL
ncbi:hypothetical protein D3C76_1087640 [compost metagenome]